MAESPCIIAKNTTVRGNLSGDEDLIVEGRIEGGSVALTKHLTVEATGVVLATIEVEDLAVHGVVRGEIRAARSVLLHGEARVVGNITAGRFCLEDGARFKGHVEMDVPLPRGVER
jgi:cytoskeletal protein CcmA (bactofilin family)